MSEVHTKKIVGYIAQCYNGVVMEQKMAHVRELIAADFRDLCEDLVYIKDLDWGFHKSVACVFVNLPTHEISKQKLLGIKQLVTPHLTLF